MKHISYTILQRLDYDMDIDQKRIYINTILRLAKQSGQYPTCLRLEGIRLDNQPIAGGAFGEVYKGDLNGSLIAVKVVRLYLRSDIEKLLRVSRKQWSRNQSLYMSMVAQDFSAEALIWKQLSHRTLN